MLFIYTFIPNSISYMWNFGSLLGGFILLQIFSGFMLILNYTNDETFNKCLDLFFDFNSRWLLHNTHVNGASVIFILLYCHMWRGLYYNRFNKTVLWTRGVTLLLITIIVAFLGYVLPWGQISYWGTTVITGLISVIPSGFEILRYIWGGSVVNYQTLTRFIRLHFITPFIILIVMLIHVSILHRYRSTNVLAIPQSINILEFNPYFLFKDIWVVLLVILFIFISIILGPYVFSEPENWNERDILKTPLHIQPEWYFLFAYAILRSIPNKLGGVLGLISAVTCLFFFKKKQTGNIYWLFFTSFLILTFVGAIPVESPFVSLSQVFSIIYFFCVSMYI